ncbi:asparagine synthase (glutamine-hydrolyzing) [Candidatus Babeliales bacterium]|nr:asparagine synthase (glutamine-hydrolyzing) [Candidatus Babeliales bacterium]
MCGIAGFCSLTARFPDDAELLLDKMQRKIAHRGPDGFGTWWDIEHGVGFAHRRLSIQDLSTAANQPFISFDGNIVLIFNGEIYNHPQLSYELAGRGHIYRSRSDTETIIHAYQEWGIGCISRLDGIFAFALFDRLTGDLFFVRDRFGVKPIYFSTQGGMLGFASEIKALWELPWMRRDLSSLAAYHYLTFMVAPSPMTIFKGIYKLPAGFLCHIKPGKDPVFREWYSPLTVFEQKYDKQFESESFCVRGIRELLAKAVEKRMLSDVPVGVLLSGGLDSSLIAALVAERGHPLQTFNIHMEGCHERDERKWARLVADHLGSCHHEIVVTEKDAFDFYESMLWHLDEPLADPVCLPFYFVTKLAKEVGVQVALVGEGADELFMGYDFFHKIYSLEKFFGNKLGFINPFVRKGFLRLAKTFVSASSWLVECIKNWSEERPLFWGGATSWNEASKNLQYCFKDEIERDPIVQQLLPGISFDFDSFEAISPHYKKIAQLVPDASLGLRMTYLELKQRLPELLLMRVDKMAMANGLEARVPFLDHEFIEFVLQIPDKFKVNCGLTKNLLKKAAKGLLPENVIYRKKVGFGVPIDSWLRKKSYFYQYFFERAGNKNYIGFKELSCLLPLSRKGYGDAIRAWTYLNLSVIQ